MIFSRSDRLAACLLEDEELPIDEVPDFSSKEAMLSDQPVAFVGPSIDYYYSSLDRRLGRKQKQKVANNTYLVRRGENIAVLYHATDIITVAPDSTTTISMTGPSTQTYLNRAARSRFDTSSWASHGDKEWRTRSTMARLSEWLPGGWQVVNHYLRASRNTSGHEWWCWANRSVEAFNEVTVEVNEGDVIRPNGMLEYTGSPIPLATAPWKEARNARRVLRRTAQG